MADERQAAPAWAVVVRDEAATRRLAALLGKIVAPDAVIVLEGDLGAGKTTFVKGLAEGLGIDPDEVSSPTFTLIHEYEGAVPLYHFDVYRLNDPLEFLDLGVEEYFAGLGVSVIEWGGRFRSQLPAERLEIRIERADEPGDAGRDPGAGGRQDDTMRRIAFWPLGARPVAWVEQLAAAWGKEGAGGAGARA
ncbi:MAG: tRNA (adenosine(37)-N6)-threonylcarbamoyltransferase complex ATPase subunit type 1 TsaE [Limnochordales bacterium]|nr:tRNA (adenosine(37)-N6)-threonylcarbamoyltransferase complex ATPase subunit type 1 TsaE [Bacillota bacterium]